MTEKLDQALSAAFRKLLRPLVGILLRHGVSHRVFSEYAKQVYVDVAARDFAVPGRKASVSRISLLTGLTRKEVSRLMQPVPDSAALAERYSRAARVITTWVREPEYSEDGEPRTLTPDGDAGFAGLVRRSGVDIPPRAVLDELLRVAAVVADSDGRLRLVNRAYIPHSGDLEKLEILGTDVADLAASIAHNLSEPPEDAFFQRKVAYDNLRAACLPELRSRVGTDAQALLERFDRFLSVNDLDSSPDASGEGGKRAVIGIYYREHDTNGES